MIQCTLFAGQHLDLLDDRANRKVKQKSVYKIVEKKKKNLTVA